MMKKTYFYLLVIIFIIIGIYCTMIPQHINYVGELKESTLNYVERMIYSDGSSSIVTSKKLHKNTTPDKNQFADKPTDYQYANFNYIDYDNIIIAEPSNEPEVPVDVSKEVVIYELPRTTKLLKEFKGASVSQVPAITFFDLDDNPIVSLFEVFNKDGNYTGYIATSCTTKYYPIVEYTTAPLPTENLNECKQVAEISLNNNVKQVQLIYLGGQDYLAKFISDNGDSVFVSLVSKMVVDNGTVIKRNNILINKFKEIEARAKKKWQRYLIQ